MSCGYGMWICAVLVKSVFCNCICSPSELPLLLLLLLLGKERENIWGYGSLIELQKKSHRTWCSARKDKAVCENEGTRLRVAARDADVAKGGLVGTW